MPHKSDGVIAPLDLCGIALIFLWRTGELTDNFCCPLCGNKRLGNYMKKRRIFWCCPACDIEFQHPDDLAGMIDERTPARTFRTSIAISTLAGAFALCLCTNDMKKGLIAFLCIVFAGCGIGYALYHKMKIRNKNIRSEVCHLKESMNKFL